MLVLDEPPDLTVEQFLAICGEHLSHDDMATLERLLSGSLGETGHPFAVQWWEHETQLRNTVVTERATRTGRDAEQYLQKTDSFDSYTRKTVSESFTARNPRDAELALDRLRWSVIEELQGYDAFSTRALLAYGLKLKLSERWAVMNKEGGAAKVEELVETMSQRKGSGK